MFEWKILFYILVVKTYDLMFNKKDNVKYKCKIKNNLTKSAGKYNFLVLQEYYFV